jgi:drug/metabolite transporter (DMT)-like permease
MGMIFLFWENGAVKQNAMRNLNIRGVCCSYLLNYFLTDLFIYLCNYLFFFFKIRNKNASLLYSVMIAYVTFLSFLFMEIINRQIVKTYVDVGSSVCITLANANTTINNLQQMSGIFDEFVIKSD